MDFDVLYNSVFLSESVVLELVDEYTLYCYYTNEAYTPGKSYKVPYRTDDTPSFVFYETNKYSNIEYMWKDQSLGCSGDIFALIQRIEGLRTKAEVLARINADFDLGYNLLNPVRREKIVLYERPEAKEARIRVLEKPTTPKGRAFLDVLHITDDVLKKYDTSQIEYYWSYDGQEYPTTAPDPTFAYRIGQYYQIYSPYASKKNKFRNNYPSNYFFGYKQLPKTGDKLIIDKSAKDVLLCHQLGYPAVCGKSETIFIPEKKMEELKNRFTTIYLMLDPDEAGRIQTDKYMEKYPWLQPRFLPKHKDKSDFCKAEGFDVLSTVLKDLL